MSQEPDNGPPLLVVDEEWSPQEKAEAHSRWLGRVMAYRQKHSASVGKGPSPASAQPSNASAATPSKTTGNPST